MRCQIPFSGKNKKTYFKMSSAEIFTQHAKHYCRRISFPFGTVGNAL